MRHQHSIFHATLGYRVGMRTVVGDVFQVSEKKAWIERVADCSKPHDAIPAANNVKFQRM